MFFIKSTVLDSLFVSTLVCQAQGCGFDSSPRMPGTLRLWNAARTCCPMQGTLSRGYSMSRFQRTLKKPQTGKTVYGVSVNYEGALGLMPSAANISIPPRHWLLLLSGLFLEMPFIVKKLHGNTYTQLSTISALGKNAVSPGNLWKICRFPFSFFFANFTSTNIQEPETVWPRVGSISLLEGSRGLTFSYCQTRRPGVSVHDSMRAWLYLLVYVSPGASGHLPWYWEVLLCFHYDTLLFCIALRISQYVTVMCCFEEWTHYL